MAKLKGPVNAGSVSFAGKEYAAKKGVVEVPEEAVASLAAHGFTRVDGDDADKEGDKQ